MAILIHVLIALSGLVYTTYVFLSPSDTKIKGTYAFIAATFASGVYLVVSMPAHMISSCETGLTYLGVMTFGILAARYRLATAQKRIK
jgi:hypothetical protein